MMRRPYLKLLERDGPAEEPVKTVRRKRRAKQTRTPQARKGAVSGTRWGYRYYAPAKVFSASAPYRLTSLEVHEHGRLSWVRCVIQVNGEQRVGEALGTCPVLAAVESLQLAARVHLTSFEIYLASPEETGGDRNESKITVWLQKKKLVAHHQSKHFHAPIAGGVAFVKALNQLDDLLS
jgi:hypothetical protein